MIQPSRFWRGWLPPSVEPRSRSATYPAMFTYSCCRTRQVRMGGIVGVFQMRQDTDVARMAAALRTPALKYRSFCNEAVRVVAPVPVPSDEQAFGVLGEALAGLADLSPEAVLEDVSAVVPAGAWWADALAPRAVQAREPQALPTRPTRGVSRPIGEPGAGPRGGGSGGKFPAGGGAPAFRRAQHFRTRRGGCRKLVREGFRPAC